MTFRHVLAHCSGLAAWRPFFQQVAQIESGGKVNFMASHGAKEFVYEEIHREKPEAPTRPPRQSTPTSTSCCSARRSSRWPASPLNRFCRDKIFRPLGIRATDFIDISLVRTRRLEPVPEMFAPTSVCAFRKRLLVGEVDDENAYAMGGVAGMRACSRRSAKSIVSRRSCSPVMPGVGFVPQKMVQRLLDSRHHGQRIDLGARMGHAVGAYSSSGQHFSPAAVGHLGFTGTSIWIEPARGIAISLLTNRVHPRRDNQAIRDFRPKYPRPHHGSDRRGSGAARHLMRL